MGVVRLRGPELHRKEARGHGVDRHSACQPCLMPRVARANRNARCLHTRARACKSNGLPAATAWATPPGAEKKQPPPEAGRTWHQNARNGKDRLPTVAENAVCTISLLSSCTSLAKKVHLSRKRAKWKRPPIYRRGKRRAHIVCQENARNGKDLLFTVAENDVGTLWLLFCCTSRAKRKVFVKKKSHNEVRAYLPSRKTKCALFTNTREMETTPYLPSRKTTWAHFGLLFCCTSLSKVSDILK